MKKYFILIVSLFPLLLNANWRVISDNPNETVIEVSLENPKIFTETPQASIGRFVAIPPTKGVTWRIKSKDSKVIPAKEVKIKEIASQAVEVSNPGILRDFRVLSVTIHPVFKEGGEIHLLKRLVLRFAYGGVSKNPLFIHPKGSKEFEKLYRMFIVNYRENPKISSGGITSTDGAKMIIVTPDEYYDEVLPLAQWKTKKGILTYIAKLSETGSSPSQIKNFLENAYDTWDPAPEYVLLVGDANAIPVYTGTDNYYATLSGDDMFNDVFIGRFPASNSTEVATMVSKSLNYEENPYMGDSLWFRKGTGIIREDYDINDTIYYNDIYHMAALMIQSGYVHVDTFTRSGGDDYSDVLQAVNDGRSFVAYRGQGVGNWWSPFDVPPDETQNGWKLPIIISTTCATINIDNPSNPYAGEIWMKAGTPNSPHGAVGFYGTVTIRSHVADIRSAVFIGFVNYVFPMGVSLSGLPICLGAAAEAGRLNLWNTYHDEMDYKGFHTLGDPELNVWTYTPKPMIVNYPSFISPGTFNIQISVYDENTSSPIESSLVCIKLDTLIYQTGYTDYSGVANITLNVPQEASGDSANLTVTAKNHHPYETKLLIAESGPFVSYTNLSFEDSTGGNGDGFLNPGEEIGLSLTYKNYGSDTAYSVRGRLHSENPRVNVVDSTDFLGTLPPGDTIRKNEAYSIYLTPQLRHNETVPLQLTLYDLSGDTWQFPLNLGNVVAAEANLLSFSLQDTIQGNGNGDIDPGEIGVIYTELTNTGGMDISSAELTISPQKLWAPLNFPDFSSFVPSLGVNDTVSTSQDPFILHVNQDAPPGLSVPLKIIITGETETYTYTDTLPFSILIGSPREAPTGPESDYFAYDNTDIVSGRAPQYEWLEIAPPGPGTIISQITNADADTVTLSLPFTFKFYGIDYNSVGVCSNGFLEMGQSTYRFGDNSQIPSVGGPKRLIAPFWDDLDPAEGGDIYQYFDSANHRFIVEFEDCVHYGGNYPETFQIVLWDPSYYPTPTGDGEITFLYKTVNDASSCTVGIEDQTETHGIQYLYNGEYDEHAQNLVSHRAILFSTNPPKNYNPIRISVRGLVVTDSSGQDKKGFLERGKTSYITLKLTNLTKSVIPNLEATLSSSTPGIDVSKKEANFGDIPHGKPKANWNSPFVVKLLPDFSDTIANFYLKLSSSGLNLPALTFTLPVQENLIANEDKRTRSLRIKQIGSNPSNGSVEWILNVPKKMEIELSIYNSIGRKVKAVFKGVLTSGIYDFHWEGTDTRGNKVPNGIYFMRLNAPKRTKIERVLILR